MKMLVLAAALVMSTGSVAFAGQYVRTAAGCSNAGDQTARPVYKRVKGKLKFVGYECVQDNRGGNGG